MVQDYRIRRKTSTTGQMADRYLITGTAGFIGFHMAKRLLEAGHIVIGYDGLTDYYDVSLKEKRHQMLQGFEGFIPVIAMLEDKDKLNDIFSEHQPDYVIHLAAQAGVRYSIEAPESYVNSNLVGGFNILEAVRAHPVKHLLFASTSSVYGANSKMPFRETDPTHTQMSFYAATKKSNETMAQVYSHLYNQPITMFRFFTVYGPWGRPDMALFKFTKAILADEPIDIYNNGELSRDFTYIDDITSAIEKLIPAIPKNLVEHDSKSRISDFRIVNIGNSQPTKLMDFVSTLEAVIGKEARKNFLPMQAGDVYDTWASTDLLKELTNLTTSTDLKTGVKAFVDWYLEYYQGTNT